jgi:hypothetical protein
MVKELVTSELAKLAVQKLAEVKLDDAVSAMRTLRRTATGSLLLPTAVTLGIGVAIGAAAGLLLAPRSGRQTREALRDLGRQKLALVRKKFFSGAEPAEPNVESVEAAGSYTSGNGSLN